MKLNKNQTCPVCGFSFHKLERQCPGCGLVVGMGNRSPNEMRALIAKINRNIPKINNEEQAKWYMDTMSTAKGVLAWCLGEKNLDIVDAATTHMEEKYGK